MPIPTSEDLVCLHHQGILMNLFSAFLGGGGGGYDAVSAIGYTVLDGKVIDELDRI
jgi:hypothetical protein